MKTTGGSGAWALTLQNADVLDNTTSVEGGGIALRGPAGVALIKDSTISGNKVTRSVGQPFSGGVSVNFDSTSAANTATLDGTLVTNNRLVGARGQGAGIGHFDGGPEAPERHGRQREPRFRPVQHLFSPATVTNCVN